MNDQMKATLSTIAAVAFLAIIGAVLARPVFTSEEPAPPAAPAESPAEKEEPTPSPTPKPTPTETKNEGDLAMAEPYPRACLKKVRPASGSGLIAAYAYGRAGKKNQVSIATPQGRRVATFAAEAPLEWSASGKFLATGRGAAEIWTAQGKRVGEPARGGGPWAWSPRSDCLVTWEDNQLVVIRPGRESVSLLEADAAGSLRFSTDGRLLMAGEDIFDLAKGKKVEDAPVSASGLGTPRKTAYASFCTELGAQFEHETCSHDGRFVAAARDGRLVLTDSDGSPVDPLTTDSGYEDAWPVWGPARTGIVFVRLPEGGGPAQIWFIPEGGRAQSTGLESVDIDPPRGDWSIYVDWNLDPPLGMTPPVPGH